MNQNLVSAGRFVPSSRSVRPRMFAVGMTPVLWSERAGRACPADGSTSHDFKRAKNPNGKEHPVDQSTTARQLESQSDRVDDPTLGIEPRP
jgi:hypothetical protein